MRLSRPRTPPLVSAPLLAALLVACGSSTGGAAGTSTAGPDPQVCTAAAPEAPPSPAPFGTTQSSSLDGTTVRISAHPVRSAPTQPSPLRGVQTVRVPLDVIGSKPAGAQIDPSRFRLILPDGRTCEALTQTAQGARPPMMTTRDRQSYEVWFRVPEGVKREETSLTYSADDHALGWSADAPEPARSTAAARCAGSPLAGTRSAPTTGFGTKADVTVDSQSGTMTVTEPVDSDMTDLEDIDARGVETTVSTSSDGILEVAGADVVMTDRRGRVCRPSDGNARAFLFATRGDSPENDLQFEVPTPVATSELRVWFAPDGTAVHGWR